MTTGIRRIRAINFRSLRNVDVELDQFHVLVGANGSGKSALFDALRFTGDLLLVGLDAAVDRRTSNFRDLVWGRPDRDLAFELAFELDIPRDMRERIPKVYDRFAISLSVHETDGDDLRATLKSCLKEGCEQKSAETKSNFALGLWTTEMQFDSANPLKRQASYQHPLVSDFVAHTFLRVGEISLENRHLRQAVRPPRFGRPGPGALPWFVRRLMQYPDRYDAWQQHIRTAIADIQDIRVKTREDDRHSYLVAVYGDGLEIPSWALSDGTLRLLALTIIAYLPEEEGRAYLIEEPENGIHPLAVEAVYRSLSSAHGAQVLIATHSPVLLACTEPKELLCFSKRNGETQIVRGDEHPHLAHWQSAADVDLLFASEVLG